MKKRGQFSDIDDYIAAAAREVRPILQRIRRTVKEAVPKARECISYQIPAFSLEKLFIYFAAFKRHIGIYPPINTDPALSAELLRYHGDKGNLKLPLSEPIPYPPAVSLWRPATRNKSMQCA